MNDLNDHDDDVTNKCSIAAVSSMSNLIEETANKHSNYTNKQNRDYYGQLVSKLVEDRETLKINRLTTKIKEAQRNFDKYEMLTLNKNAKTEFALPTLSKFDLFGGVDASISSSSVRILAGADNFGSGTLCYLGDEFPINNQYAVITAGFTLLIF